MYPAPSRRWQVPKRVEWQRKNSTERKRIRERAILFGSSTMSDTSSTPVQTVKYLRTHRKRQTKRRQKEKLIFSHYSAPCLNLSSTCAYSSKGCIAPSSMVIWNLVYMIISNWVNWNCKYYWLIVQHLKSTLGATSTRHLIQHPTLTH
jgi:hypothetical protein